MAKKRTLEADEQTLTEKIKAQSATASDGTSQDPAVRALRHRLRRVQRKRRRLTERMRQAAPKQAEGGEAQPAAG